MTTWQWQAARWGRTLASCCRRSEAPTAAAAAASEAPTAADKLHKQTPFLTTMTQLHQNHLPLQQLTLSHRQKMKAFPCLVIAKVQKCAFKVRWKEVHSLKEPTLSPACKFNNLIIHTLTRQQLTGLNSVMNSEQMTLTCCQDHMLTENIWFVWSETSCSGGVMDAGQPNDNRTLKIELLSWKLSFANGETL